MHIFTCTRNYEAMLTCIYVAWASGFGHKNIKLEIEPFGQYSIFDEYTHVDADTALAQKVMDAVNMKLSPYFYSEIAYISMGYEEDVLDIMYRMMLYGFTYGNKALNMVQFDEIARYKAIRKRIGNEICRFKEFSRFHRIESGAYVAHIEPKSNLLLALGPIFQDRMPSENWMIVDDVHKEAIIHPINQNFYLRILNDEELEHVLETERENDEYTDMWKVFFETIAIKERENPTCQNNHFPKWTRKHVVEFMKDS